MEGHVLLRSLKLQKILSYGRDGVNIELQPLNVLVGPNGSGKSNLIEALRLLKAVSTDLTQPIIHAGGVSEWLWKGEEYKSYSILIAALCATIVDTRDPYCERIFTTLTALIATL